MLFTSFSFVLFFGVVFVLYWFLFNRNLTAQNLLLLGSSYLFYGVWDLRFLALLFLISAANYVIGLGVRKSGPQRIRVLALWSGLILNIGTLVVFKYFNFFLDGFRQIAASLNISLNIPLVEVFLPVGISFYIFLALSYILDIYKGRLEAEKNVLNVLLSLSFFPIILAGPLQRPATLLPQIKAPRKFRYLQATDGLKQILWGVFMKVVIADRCVEPVKMVFDSTQAQSGSTLLLGVFLFAVQIYADFSGYSNIAIGIGKLMGFNIMRNFANPYFSTNIKEFWTRWNISLTSWFRDYVFLPLSYRISRNIRADKVFGIKTELWIYILGSIVTWLLTGLWHGANVTFIVWGLLQGTFLTLYHVSFKSARNLYRKFGVSQHHPVLVLFQSVFTLILVLFSWTFFRSGSLVQAGRMIGDIFSDSLLTLPSLYDSKQELITMGFILFAFATEWAGRNSEYGIASIGEHWPRPLRWMTYYFFIAVVLFLRGSEQQFIYFQF